MKICVIGAGITGLSIAQLLKNNHEIIIFEKNEFIGGIARVRMVSDVPYHLVGGHCFNSKHKDVLDFVFNKIMDLSCWHSIKRQSQIHFHDHFIDYPIEYSIKQIAAFDMELALKITEDFFAAKSSDKSKDLADWFRKTFGNTLSNEYLLPYNMKIWGLNPSKMDPAWVLDKLPIPDKKSFFRGLISNEKDMMPHASFYYPSSNTQNTFIQHLSFDLKININTPVLSIEKMNNQWVINGNEHFDTVINTMPLNDLPHYIQHVPCDVLSAASKLKFNRVSNMLWKSTPVENTWTYYPDKATCFHRHIHIGNFVSPKVNYTITEAIGLIDDSKLIKYGNKIDYLTEPVDYNVSDHAYVLFDKNYQSSRATILSYLDSIGLHTLGRFGEWEYYNMDICIHKAMQLANIIN